jgi:hypothetical protein
LAIVFILIFFSGMLPGQSVFMLSMEKGRIFVERFSLSHIMKNESVSKQKKSYENQVVSGFSLHLTHRHIKLTSCTIPEKEVELSGAGIQYANIAILLFSLVSLQSGKVVSLSKLREIATLKLPIASLQQATVLLI